MQRMITRSPRCASRRALLLLSCLLSAMPAAAQEKPTLTPADYGRWEALTAQPQPLSADGRWLVYGIGRTDGQRELRLANLQTFATTTRAFGERPAFSADSQWLADLVGMSEADEASLKKAKKPVHKSLRLTRLATGETTTIDGIESFAFSASGSHLAMRRYPPQADDAAKPNEWGDEPPSSAALIIRTLATGVDLSIGQVSQFAWQSKGSLLAIAVAADGGTGNGVQLYDGASGRLRVLDSSSSIYSGLAWRKDADDLAVLRSVSAPSRGGLSNTLLTWTGLAAAETRRDYVPADDAAFPAGMRVMSSRPPSWSDDGAYVFIGLRTWAELPAEQPAGSDDERPAVDVWHPRDAIVMPKQKLDARDERRKSLLAAWHVADGRLRPIAKSLAEIVTPIKGRAEALVVDTAPYAMARSIGRPAADFAVADLRSGARRALKAKIDDREAEVSPRGRYLLYLLDDHYWTIDLESGAQVNLTGKVASTFIDRESDATVAQKPPFGVAGWTEGDASVLLYDRFDIWELRADGSGAVRLTNGAAEEVRHRYLPLDAAPNRPGSRQAREAVAIDRGAPIYLSLFGERSKKSGFARLRLDGPRPAVERLAWDDHRADRLVKAADADVYAYIVQSFTDSPDYFVSTGADAARLASPRQVSTTNSFMSNYAWGRTELIDYRSARGQRLQGALRYPANYQPGRRYPMVVYMYEKRSDGLHNFSVPSEREYYNIAAFTQHGYFLFEPDIVFRPREPGLSVVECVLPAVQEVVKKGFADAAKVGIIGHSWGGFDTVYLATHTTAFAAGVAGAPITDLISNYGNHHWSSGIAETDHIETGQQRMAVPLYEDLQAYIRNSAVFGASTMRTPLMVEVGDDDGTVHWHQGVELYNIARRAGKQVVLVVYAGEDHGLRKKANQVDYQRRIFQWFDHYLKGQPAPAWITEGAPYVKRPDQ